MLPRPPTSPLFPYTTLFRSPESASSRARSSPPATSAVPDASGRRADSTSTRTPLARARCAASAPTPSLTSIRSEEHTSELQSLRHLVCRLLLEKKNTNLQHD